MRFHVLLFEVGRRNLQAMTRRPSSNSPTLSALCGLFLCLLAPGLVAAEPSPAAVSAFNSYINAVESRLARQHRSTVSFLASVDSDPANGAHKQETEDRLLLGDLIVEQLPPSAGRDLPGAMLHHWRGTAFVPAATAADFERLMKDFNSYPQHFSPQVLQAKVLAQQEDHLQAVMRIRQQHILAVVMDTSFDIDFGRLDAQHGYSLSRSTRVIEIASPGAAAEHALDSTREHGFLWHLNTYWSYEQRDGGLYMQIESVSLTRCIPRGLGWAVGPFVESVPRESLEFTLRAVCNALRK
jgi:hypothetical protein